MNFIRFRVGDYAVFKYERRSPVQVEEVFEQPTRFGDVLVFDPETQETEYAFSDELVVA